MPAEIEELHAYGITRIYSPDDGRKMGLEGMIEDVVKECDFSLNGNGNYTSPMTLGEVKDVRTIARKITNVENGIKIDQDNFNKKIPVLGITGTGGAGKSSVTDEIVRRFLNNYTDKTIAVISVDPSKKKTGGALLGDRIRMNAISSPRAYMRSLATTTFMSPHGIGVIPFTQAPSCTWPCSFTVTSWMNTKKCCNSRVAWRITLGR